jgi:hypothetical protein|tara:strand:- start:5884 stop:6015 length:132 start_codon:yes stop_codon:yes gene_type:complete
MKDAVAIEPRLDVRRLGRDGDGSDGNVAATSESRCVILGVLQE